MVNKITTPPTPNEIVGKINEIIDDKADNSTVVHKAGTETITGFKTLSAGAKITTTQSGAILELESAASDTNFLLKRTNGTTCVLESGAYVGLFGTYSNHRLQIRTNYVNRMEFGTNGSVTLATAPSENSNNNQVATTAWTNSKIPTVNNSTITLTQGGKTKGSFTLNQSTGTTIELDAGGAGGYHPDLFSFQWSDHLLNNVSWLRADTFSWQDGTVYSDAYNHLSADISGKTLQSETIGAVTVQFYLADDGHKICPASEESKVASIYTNTGVSWYYILDTTNTRFKLPRENPVREVLEQRAPVIGNGMTLGLTNGSGNGTLGTLNDDYSRLSYLTQYGQQVSTGSGRTNGKGILGVTTDPEKSGLVVDFSEATGCYKGKKYLYFYVGDYTQTAIEQTAGLNAELFNGKLDLDAANLSTAGKSLISGLGMPSDTYESVTVGANGATYVAPANGWFCIRCKVSDKTSYFQSGYSTSYGGSGQLTSYDFTFYGGAVIPMSKGQTMNFYYEQNTQDRSIRFVYAQGSESEAS